jgi:putative hemolysin
MGTSVQRPFRLPDSASRGFARLLRSPVERILAFPQLNARYGVASELDPSVDFAERALESLNISYRIAPDDLKRIPTSGPVIVVANHPFGGLDGLILTALLRRIRPDTRLLANRFLSMIPDLRDAFFFVDPFGGPDATARNIGSMKSAIRWVKQGGILGVFPSGEVSQRTRRDPRVVDPRWSDTIGRLVKHTGAAVVPVYFEGQNSALFQFLGLIHPRLRTLMLPRELLKKQHSRVTVRVGNVIPQERLAEFDDVADLTSYLRVRTYLLAGRRNEPPARPLSHPEQRKLQPLIPAVDPAPMEIEVQRLTPDRKLAEHGDLAVMYASAAEIPTVLREIGRLRELTFRLVGEGTGQSTDIDRFDDYYLHLFVWSKSRRQVVGAYRMGLTDEILTRFGADGIYTSTLFRYRGNLLAQIGPAIELGRSFVRPEYQKEFSPLLLLWKGVGHYCALHPKYRRVFGPVSISSDYHSLTKQLLVRFLEQNFRARDLSRQIEPRNPPVFRHKRQLDDPAFGTVVRDVDEVQNLVREIESDRLSIPVLLRQYLKLNARLLGFNVDPDFGDVLDALMLVDLTQMDRPLINRYLGPANVPAFLAYHGCGGE